MKIIAGALVVLGLAGCVATGVSGSPSQVGSSQVQVAPVAVHPTTQTGPRNLSH